MRADGAGRRLGPVLLVAVASQGTLPYQAFVPAGTPQLLYDPAIIEVIDIPLPTPFVATGQRFVSVQASFVAVLGLLDLRLQCADRRAGETRNNLSSSTWGAYSHLA